MKGFTNTTKMRLGHDTSAAGRTVGRVQSFAQGGPVFGTRDRISGEHEQSPLTDKGKYAPEGHSAVHREIPSNEMQAEHGGKGELIPGYSKGGKPEKHFHVHHHHHEGGTIKTKSKSYRKSEHAAEREVEGAKPMMAKGGKRPFGNLKKGALHKDLHVAKGKKIPLAKIKKAEHSENPTVRKRAQFAENARHFHHAHGGHIYDDTHEIAPDYATGGTIDTMNAGGAAYGGMATGGTIDRYALGGAPPAQPMPAPMPMRGNPNLANLARIAAARGAPHPMPGRGAPPAPRMQVAPMPGSPLMARAKGGGVTMPMQRAARSAVSEHVGHPAPQGHKGLGRMIGKR